MHDPSERLAAPGVVVDGRYRVVRILGEGGAGVVALARDLRLDREVALKLLRRGGLLGDLGRFEDEARTLAALRHPRIVAVLDYGIQDGAPYLVLEAVVGGTLRTRMALGRMEPVETVALARDLASALEHAHGQGVVHRDVKPENVLLAGDGSALLADFGLARVDEGVRRTATGLVLGTPWYMAPEVLRGHPVTAAADVFAWGCVVAEAGRGRMLRSGGLEEIAARPEVELGPLEDFPRGVVEVLSASLAPDPGSRPSAGELLRLLPEAAASDLARRQAATAPLATRKAILATATDATLGVTRVLDRSRPGRRVGRVVAGAAALGILGGMALRHRAGEDPAALPPPRVGELPEDRRSESAAVAGVLAEWKRLASGVEAGPRLVRAGEILDLEADPTRPYVQEMGKARVAGALPVEFGRMREDLYQGLPDELSQGSLRKLAGEVLSGRAGGAGAALDLAEALARLEPLDAFVAAFGVVPRLGIRTLLDRLWGRTLAPWPGPVVPAPPVPAEGIRAPGRYTLFEWTRDVDRAMPRLLPRASTMSPWEVAQYIREENLTRGAWRTADHEVISAPLRLAGDPGRIRLRVRFANHLAPNRLRLEVASRDVDYYGNPDHDPTGHWVLEDPPWWELSVEVPPGVMTSGENLVAARVEPLPGLPTWGGLWLDRIEVEVAAATLGR